MKKIRFKKIDAFATSRSSGNPAAVIYLESINELSEQEKLQIAKEMQGFVSEVGFVCPGKETDFSLHYYSSEREVAFCGHATIAILNDVVATDDSLKGRANLSIATRSEVLTVENRHPGERCVYVSAPAPRFSSRGVRSTDVARALRCDEASLAATRPIGIVNGGLETLIVPMSGLSAILDVHPDIQELKEFCLHLEVDIVLLYTEQVVLPECRYRTRVFAPTFGYLEDPATGSGNAALGYHLLAQGGWTGETIKIEQNGSRMAPNFVQLFSRKGKDGEVRVWFGGGAVVKIDGWYHLE
jgi:PhzF family phenazine biosynthesis protein